MSAKDLQRKPGRLLLPLIAVAIVGLVGGYLLGHGRPEAPTRSAAPEDELMAAGHRGAAEQVWTCSMHPQIRQPKPGQCPLCGMDLIPVEAGDTGAGVGAAELTLSPSARRRAQIETAPVERRYATAEIRMVGKVTFDETRLATIAARVPGRLERLYVDYTGVPVRTGDHLVEIYSPELLSAQAELIQAARAAEQLAGSDLSAMRATGRQTVAAAREKLRLWGMTAEQIAAIEARGEPRDRMTIYAPIGGIVVAKPAVEGMYVETGTPIYTVADLSHVWVMLDAYESDLTWLRYGQDMTFTTEAYPGEPFRGRISFIDPVLDARTRTVKVRVNVANADGRLKPEMFVRAVVHSQVAAGGRVMEPSLAGKWICPMHPEVIDEEANDCRLCGMPLVRAEALGYSPVAVDDTAAPLVIPASAPLITGKRAVVYVEDPLAPGTYQGREIELGPRAGDDYIVRAGLREGERVVVRGNFKIDSAIQIQAGRSMMSPGDAGQHAPDDAGGGDHADHTMPDRAMPDHTMPDLEAPAAFRAQIDTLLARYYAIHEPLSLDQLAAAQQQARSFRERLDAITPTRLSAPAASLWSTERRSLAKSSRALADAAGLGAAREAFLPLTQALTQLVTRFGTSAAQPVLQFHCPMAFGGQGADWLQDRPGTENPYYGNTMYRCGSQTATLVPGTGGAE